MCEAFLLGSQLAILAMLTWAAHQYIRVRRRVNVIARRMDKQIDELLGISKTEAEVEKEGSVRQQRRERLAALAAGGQARQYGLSNTLTAEQVDQLSDVEVEKLYARYEARLGAAMTKTLGQAALQLYAGLASRFLPIPPENRLALVADLEADPFVEHALSAASCEIYHRYGMFLAPLTAALTTARHCQFGQEEPPTIDNGDRGDTRGDNGGDESDSRA